MKPDRWQKIERLFYSVLELSAEERAAFLDKACAGDESLRREVESLIESDEQADSLIESPAIEAVAPLIADARDGSAMERRIGYYTIISLIAEGGMGKVYLAEDGRLGRKVALKFLHATFTTDEGRVRRFEQEARAASALNHPNILTIYDFGQIDDRRFLVTEYVEGETLRSLIDRGGMMLSEALDAVIQAAGALAAAHQAGIIHRDIKPENIMLRPDGYVKVLDFGLAKLTEQQTASKDAASTALAGVKTESGVVMGTVRYMSPEQARGTQLDARTDIFSLGIVIYEMVTSRAPFGGETPSHVIVEILEKEPRPLSDYWPEAPAELQRIVSKALAKEREERYQSINDLLADLKNLRQRLQGEDGLDTAINKAPGKQTNPRVSRTGAQRGLWHRGVRFVPAAVALLPVIAFMIWFFILRPAPEAPVAPMKTIPLTSLPGREEWPAFSPEGGRIAFAWNKGEGDDFDIYVKLIGAGEPLRLTTHPGFETSPTWSPDGSHIIYTRLHERESGIYIVPALGGPERKLTSLGFASTWYGEPIMAIWSPDGEYVAYPDRDSPQSVPGIHLLSVETFERRRLTEPPARHLGDWHPAFSPDGKTLAFTRWTSEGIMDIYTVPANGGEPRRLTFDNTWIRGLCWTSDGSSIVFSSLRQGSHRLWKVSVSDGALEPLALGGDQALPTGLRPPLSISRDGNSLTYSLPVEDVNIWRFEIPGSSKQRASWTKLISSSKYDGMPQVSPDGRKIVFQSERTGLGEIWLTGADGSNPVQLTSLGSPLSGTPRWSPDSRYIAFDARQEGHSDIYVVSAEGGPARRVTTESFNDIVPSWSRDGRWIYFCSNRGESLQIWKAPAEGGEAMQVTRQGGFAAFESPDGATLYYTKYGLPGLWKMP
ncbi:MAG TPA: protein kinase, partial [Blastocatellia bacterium]|nr:protein kinase [Blastocatellia bacterium]